MTNCSVPTRPARPRETGFTVIELVVAMAIAAVLLGVGAMNLRPAAERTAANAVLSFIQQSRFDSIKTNRPVVVSYNAASQQLEAARMNSSSVTTCASATEVVRRLPLTDYRGVQAVNTDFAVLWLPSGQPRSCPAGSSPLSMETGAAFQLAGQRSTQTVAVSAGGEVSVQ